MGEYKIGQMRVSEGWWCGDAIVGDTILKTQHGVRQFMGKKDRQRKGGECGNRYRKERRSFDGSERMEEN